MSYKARYVEGSQTPMVDLFRTGSVVYKVDRDTREPVIGLYEYGTVIGSAYTDTRKGRLIYYKVNWGLNDIEYCSEYEIEMK